MKKTLLLLILLSALVNRSSANHITGGTIFYTRDSAMVGNGYVYHITLVLYRDHNSTGAQLDNIAYISVFNRRTGATFSNHSVNMTSTSQLHLTNPNPCINNPPMVWYDVGYYTFTVTLPVSADGYTIGYQRCCRIAGINNLIGSNNVGATYTAEIPGNTPVSSGPANSSAAFDGSDMVIICAGNYFCYDFGATDPDGDILSYSLCNAYIGGGTGQGAGGGPNTAQPNPPLGPPYSTVPYNGPEFSGTQPLGNGVTLDPNTGMLCGVAPPPGIYVVTVCVTEFRGGIPIATQRKDLQIKVGDCDVVKATLPASFPVCDDFSRTFENLSPPNALIKSYFWDFGDGDTSNSATPTHTYADTGRYTVKLVVNRNDPCGDSALSVANVYPGFFPGFTYAGICINKPTSFFDSTRTVYGVVNGWTWNFGDNNTVSDTSHLQNPVYTFNQLGVKNVSFIVSSSKGCIDTVFKQVNIIDKPVITMLPRDTLICNGDQVQIGAAGMGNFSWTGPAIVSNANTPTPTVAPTTTSTYFARLDDNGCINQDSMQVRVVDFVSLQARADTVICATDPVQLGAVTNGLRYTWSPAATLTNATILNPVATPVATTTYRITAIIGHCSATDDVTVSLVPYPIAQAGPDTTICYQTSAQLNASMVASSFSWSPAATLSNPSILNPVASPRSTTRYVLTVHDILGCPKPGRDTVTVTVLPRVIADAGRDTAVVVGQPLQFNGEGGISYSWSPPLGLNATNIEDPVGLYDGSNDSIRYQLVVRDAAGCADSATILVKVFKTSPQIFVPTAFTPNGDGRNDVFRPIAVGISKMEFFRVYNRWGQLVFSTQINGQGWDGKIGGREQATGTFVWLVRGVDFTGKVVFAKGTVTLIR